MIAVDSFAVDSFAVVSQMNGALTKPRGESGLVNEIVVSAAVVAEFHV